MIEDKLAQVGLILPKAAKPTFAYVPVTLHDGVAYVSGQLPKIDGEVRVFGKVGREVTLDAARKEARVCALQALACLKEALGDLSRLRRVLKLTGFVASAPGFNEQPKVIDAASELLVELLGESGRHARSAIGVAELPRDAGGRDRIRSHLCAIRKRRPAKGRLAITIDKGRRDDVAKVRRATRATTLISTSSLSAEE